MKKLETYLDLLNDGLKNKKFIEIVVPNIIGLFIGLIIFIIVSLMIKEASLNIAISSATKTITMIILPYINIAIFIIAPLVEYRRRNKRKRYEED